MGDKLTKKTNYSLFKTPFSSFIESFFGEDFFNDSLFPTFLFHNERLGSCDIEKTSDSYIISVDVPGLTKDDISIEIDNKLITIKGERKPRNKNENKEFLAAERSYRRFERTFVLPDDTIIEDADAKIENGVLIIVFKRNTNNTNIKTIKIN